MDMIHMEIEMKLNTLKASFIILFTSVCMATTGYCQDAYQTVRKKGDLPTGGEFVANPKKKSEIYYFTNASRMWTDKSNAQKHSGLYRSADEGQTWNLVCDFFEFKELFINPRTGKLFAIIEDKWLAEHNEYLVPHRADKAIASTDGKRWTDIMGKQKHVAMLSNIFQDPDHPDRVCLEYSLIRGIVLQAKDDNYSDWDSMVISEWEKKHPTHPARTYSRVGAGIGF